MKTSNQRHQYISANQVVRAALIIRQQWKEVMSTAQARANIQNQERRALMHQAIQSADSRRRAG